MAERDVWATRMVEEIPALRAAVGGLPGWAELRGAAEDVWLAWRGIEVHLEVLAALPDAPTVLFHHGYGAYARLYLPFLGCLHRQGFNVVALDRPGHGLSGGRRGDCTAEWLASLTRHVLDIVVRGRFSGPVVLLGTSAGGMLTTCILPYLDDEVAAAVCHNTYDPRYGRARLGRVAQRAAEAVPWLRFRYRWIPPRIRHGISTYPVLREWFTPGADPVAAYDQTLRSVLSMSAGYRAPKPFAAIRTPVLVIAGERDAMVPANRTQRSFAALGLPCGSFELVNGAHMLLHEDPEACLRAIIPWWERVSSAPTES